MDNSHWSSVFLSALVTSTIIAALVSGSSWTKCIEWAIASHPTCCTTQSRRAPVGSCISVPMIVRIVFYVMWGIIQF